MKPQVQRCSIRSSRQEKKAVLKESHCEDEKGLQVRVNKAIRRNEGKCAIVDQFTVYSKGFLTAHNDTRWVVLDPANATLAVWDHPPDENCPPESNSFMNRLSGGSRYSNKPLKELCLSTLRDVDCNPSFLNIFLSFKGDAFYCFTAPNKGIYDKWTEALAGYDVFAVDAIPSKKECAPRLKNLPVFKHVQSLF